MAGPPERLCPVGGEPLDMLGVEAVAEGMSDHLVGHHPTMPGISKTAQAVVATRRLEDSLHKYMMTILPRLFKTMAPAGSDHALCDMDVRGGGSAGDHADLQVVLLRS